MVEVAASLATDRLLQPADVQRYIDAAQGSNVVR